MRKQAVPNYGRDGLSGDYSSWGQAAQESTGYDGSEILDRTRNALLKVRDGEAPYERDSVVFDEIQYAWPLLSGLLWVAARAEGRLDVLDFGGSLGSTYFQNRVFFADLRSVRWNVVEQPGHVAVGRRHFEMGALHFYESMETCLAEARPNVVVLSSVLQYLERPYDLLEEIDALEIDNLIIDRTSFWAGPTDRISVQMVPPEIYSASYPIRIFSRSAFLRKLETSWTSVVEFDTIDALPNQFGAFWKGMILRRKVRTLD